MDGGLGMARALGFRFLDAEGHETILTPGDLPRLERIDDGRARQDLGRAQILALHDVATPLLGPRGAARLFGAQKGASAEQIASLDEGLGLLAGAIRRWKGAAATEIASLPGGGSAGGLGAGAVAFLGAKLEPGASYLLKIVEFTEKLVRCVVLVTGEGALDGRSFEGKLTGALLEKAVAAGKRAVIVAGRCDGALPAGCRSDLEILTGKQLPGEHEILTGPDLAALGRIIAARLSRE